MHVNPDCKLTIGFFTQYRIILDDFAPCDYVLQIKSVTAGNALDWYKCGWKIFSADMVSWVLMILIFFVLVLVLGFIPLLGMIVIYLLLPLLQAGLLMAAERAENGAAISPGDLFAAFKMEGKRNGSGRNNAGGGICGNDCQCAVYRWRYDVFYGRGTVRCYADVTNV